eukprot:TRINITY_DN1736_c0_g4_i1.p1 TRINITY_DN1736_c0_g4~~TRINITY_DN1736_c0_g4_i1.p1  ORF type:complete len:398 (-),score=85.62 TRINITY_DN1736_c0_g4_i1:465-1658(-)
MQDNSMDLECLLESIDTRVQKELKPVSYKWLSLKFNIPVNNCKKILHQYYKQNEDKVKVMYFVSGWSKNSEDGALELRVVTDDKLEQTKNQMEEIMSVHVYSLAPSIPQNLNSIRTDDWQLISELHNKMKLGEVEPGESPLEKNFGSQIICRNAARKQIQKFVVQQPKQSKNIEQNQQEKQSKSGIPQMFNTAKKSGKNKQSNNKQKKQEQQILQQTKNVVEKEQSVLEEKNQQQQQSLQQRDILDSDLEDQDEDNQAQKQNIIESDNEENGDCEEKMDIDDKQNDGKRKIQQLNNNNVKNFRAKKRKVQKVTFNDKGEEVVETVEEDIPENEVVEPNENRDQVLKQNQQKNMNQNNNKASGALLQTAQPKQSGLSNTKGKSKKSKQSNITSFFKKQ